MNIAVILAGGIGKRLGAGKPKQFVELCGKPMILYSMEIYQKSSQIDAIEIVCVKEYIVRMVIILMRDVLISFLWLECQIMNGMNAC